MTDFSLQILQARRIQEFMFPDKNEIEGCFSDYFIMHRPKEEVGGDFFWFKKVNQHLTALVVGDCTGHGIEGAMATMIALFSVDQEFEYKHTLDLPGFVTGVYNKLEKFNKKSTQTSSVEYSLGFEMSVTIFDQKKMIYKSISTGIPTITSERDEIHLFKPKKMINWQSWQDHAIETVEKPLVKGQKFYIYSDGLTDQYDDADKKKLGCKNLQEIIRKEKSFSKTYYNDELNKWMGNNEQLDDILLMGIKI